MICTKCHQHNSIQNHHDSLCGGCLSNQIEKRVKKSIRKDSLLDMQDLVAVGEFMTFFLQKITGKPFTSIPMVKMDNSILVPHKGTWVLPWTVDHESSEVLRCFLTQTTSRLLGPVPNCRKILLAITDKEASLYAQHFQLPWNSLPPTIESSIMQEMVNLYPQSNHMLGKSSQAVGKHLSTPTAHLKKW